MQQPAPVGPVAPIQFMDADSNFGFYLSESKQIRQRYGIGKNKEGKFFIENLEIIEKLDSMNKERLRTWCKLQKANGRWQ